MLKTDQNFIGMAFRPDFETIGMPQRGDIFKRPGFIDGIFFSDRRCCEGFKPDLRIRRV